VDRPAAGYRNITLGLKQRTDRTRFLRVWGGVTSEELGSFGAEGAWGKRNAAGVSCLSGVEKSLGGGGDNLGIGMPWESAGVRE